MTRLHYDPELFYPLDGRPRRQKFATVDLESKDGPSEKAGFTRPFLGGLFDGARYWPFTDTNDGGDPMTRWWRPGGCVDRLMHACLSRRRIGTTYYCHNGGAFDFLFFLTWLMRNVESMGLSMTLVPVGNSRLLSIHLRVRGQKWGGWTFLDSLRTLPMGLDDAGKSFGKGGKALGELRAANGELFTLDAPSWDPGWIPYNERDCRLLFDVLETAHDLVETEFGGEMGLTAPATAMKTFRRAFLKAPINRDIATHAFVREGYFGGRTEPLATEVRHGSYYDVNSSYPDAMTKPMPVGGAESWGASEPPLEWRQNRIGFARVTVHVPDDIALPPLPVRADGAYFPEHAGLDGKLLFPTGTLRGVWEWGELQNAVEHGCEITEWHESVWYLAGPLLAEFVATLYRYRDKAHCFRCGGAVAADYHCKKCDQPGYLVGLDAWAKLLLNSLYGKFGQRSERTSFYYRGDPLLPDGSTPLVAEDPNCPLWVAQTEVDSPFILPQVAARVTALARVTLYRAAMQAMTSVVRECWRCHSKTTYRGRVARGSRPEARAGGNGEDNASAQAQAASRKPQAASGWVLGDKVGGSGTHGDPEAAVLGLPLMGPTGGMCPCGGCIETRQGRVYYMDTDSIVTDAHLPTSKKLGGLKDEVPRFSGFVHGRFYASKMYHLAVEPSWLAVDVNVRKAMMNRDGGYLGSLGLQVPPQQVDDAARDAPSAGDKTGKGKGEKPSGWWSTRAKGLSRKRRTPENLQKLYDGALARLEWSARPENREADGSVIELPTELELAGTVIDERLEQFGTLANIIDRDENGEAILHESGDGYLHVTSTPFVRGPLVVKVPRRLHLEGAKRKMLPNGESVPHRVDMTGPRPRWWQERQERRERLREMRAKRPPTSRQKGA